MTSLDTLRTMVKRKTLWIIVKDAKIYSPFKILGNSLGILLKLSVLQENYKFILQ